MSIRLLIHNRIEQADLLFTASALLPLGQPFVHDAGTNSAPSAIRPFGLRYAVVPPNPIMVDLSSVRYDTDRQVCVDEVDMPIFGRHTDGQTSTQTSDGYKSMDSDTDHRED